MSLWIVSLFDLSPVHIGLGYRKSGEQERRIDSRDIWERDLILTKLCDSSDVSIISLMEQKLFVQGCKINDKTYSGLFKYRDHHPKTACILPHAGRRMVQVINIKTEPGT